MKQAYFLILYLVLLLATGCKKEKVNPIDQLPPATHEGKLTFGCLVNGKPFTPKAASFISNDPTNCYYMFVDGGYHFHVSASDKSTDVIYNVNINTNGLSIKEGAVIPLTIGNKGEASGAYAYGTTYQEYRTNQEKVGELKITYLDEDEQIVAGTFWFDAVNEAGEKVEIREGRFDMLYHK